MIKINISKDFSDTPGGRYEKEGSYSGETFRKNILEPKYKEAKLKNEKLEVNMDGCYGFPSSFIDESFGELSRELEENILSNISIISNDEPSLVDDIKKCIYQEKRK